MVSLAMKGNVSICRTVYGTLCSTRLDIPVPSNNGLDSAILDPKNSKQQDSCLLSPSLYLPDTISASKAQRLICMDTKKVKSAEINGLNGQKSSVLMKVLRWSFNDIIHGCAKEKNYILAWKLILQMQNLGLQPTSFTYDGLIRAVVSQRNFGDAMKMLKKMQQENLKIRDSTLATLSVTFSIELQLDLAESLLNKISECLHPHPYNALLASCDAMVDPAKRINAIERDMANNGFQHSHRSLKILVPRNRYWGLHPPPAPLQDVVDDGLMTIQRASFLRKAGVETIVDNDHFLNPLNRADLLESAIKNISRYLEACREKILTQSVSEGVDTLLTYLYRALNRVEDMERLASSTNWCVVEELEHMLEELGHLRTLAFLYASKGMSSKAVSIWRILARNYSSSLRKDPALETIIQDRGENLISGKAIAAAEASKILEESSDQDLILQHLGWIADISQVLAVEVLTSDKREIQLSPDEVVTSIDPQKVEILQRYLQWLIEDQDCFDTQLHTLYGLSLAKSAIESFEFENISESLASGNTERKNLTTLRNSIFQTPVKERLQFFLQSSVLYDPEEVLDLIEGSELWLEKAIQYRRLGQETLVLQILALKLEDSEAAEQYCAEIGRSDTYMQLLEMYLDPQDGKEPMFTAAVRLLHNHGESLDPLQVLEKLSPDMPLQLASETLLRMFRARVHHHRQGQIVHNLSRAVDIDARLSRLDERSRHMQINDESLCDSCNARLGTKLFAMYPDDTVVCYKCYRRQGESVSGRNFKEDILIKPGWLVSR